MTDTSTKQKPYGILDLLWDARDTILPVRGSAKQVLSALILRSSRVADGPFTCFPSYQQLADDTQLDRKTVLSAIESLEAAKLISVVREKKERSKENAVNHYTINSALIRALKEQQKTQDKEFSKDQLEDEYLAHRHLRQGVVAAIRDIDRDLYKRWQKLWNKLLADARSAYNAGGLDAVRFPAYVDDDYISQLTIRAHQVAGGEADFFLPVPIPGGHQIETERGEDGSWRFRISPFHRYRHLSPAEIEAEFRRDEQKNDRYHAEAAAEFEAEKAFVEKIGVDIYKAWLRVEFWDEEYEKAIAPGKTKDEVIALLQSEKPTRPGISEKQPQWDQTLGPVYREQALAGAHPPAWAFD